MTAGDWLAADHAGQVRTGDVPRYDRWPSSNTCCPKCGAMYAIGCECHWDWSESGAAEPRRPATDLSCPECGAAFGVDCGCGLDGYDERLGYVGHERLVEGE